MQQQERESGNPQPTYDEKLEDVLRRLMRLIKHTEGERNVNQKILVQTVKDFLAKETF